MLGLARSFWGSSKRRDGLHSQSQNDFTGRAASLYQVLRQARTQKVPTWRRWMVRLGLRGLRA
jgi:hypothetical protein